MFVNKLSRSMWLITGGIEMLETWDKTRPVDVKKRKLIQIYEIIKFTQSCVFKRMCIGEVDSICLYLCSC